MAGMLSILKLKRGAETLLMRLNDGQMIKDAVMNNSNYIEDMNTEDQLFEKGVNRLGIPIMDYQPYSPMTMEIKRMKGQPYDRVTLRDTGDFHQSFRVEATLKDFVISADDWKAEKLKKKYGKGIFGLTEENLRELTWEYIYPDLMNDTKKILNDGTI